MMFFWNGNKSPARAGHELAVLQAVIAATVPEFGPADIVDDRTDYPDAEDEAGIFASGTDVLVTVSGNPKFARRDKIVIDHPLCRGLLGCRLLVVRRQHLAEFAAIETIAAMAEKTVGIPATWADAELFRANNFRVAEAGLYRELFARLKRGEFDYLTLGANEIEEAFDALAIPAGGLCIEPTLMLRCPISLVFYVHPDRKDLADRIARGIRIIEANGDMEQVFQRHYGGTSERLLLRSRRVFSLTGSDPVSKTGSNNSSL